MNLAIDYDGTIADTNGEKIKWMKEHLGREDIPNWLCNHTECVPIIGEIDYRKMGRFVYERESTLAASEVPGALSTLRAFADAGHKLYLVTARPDSRMQYSLEWLQLNGIAHLLADAISAHGTTKVEVCARIGAQMLIDDDPRYLEGIVDPELRKVLLQHGRPDTPAISSDTEFYRTWTEIQKAVR